MGLLDRLRSVLPSPDTFRSRADVLIAELATTYGLAKKRSHLRCITATQWPDWWEGRLEGRLLALRHVTALDVYLGGVEEFTRLYLGRVGPGRKPPAGRLEPPAGPRSAELAGRYRLFAGDANAPELGVPAIQDGLLTLSPHVEQVSFYPVGLDLRINTKHATRADVERDVKIALSIVKALENRDTPLMQAADRGDLAGVQALLAGGADPNARGVRDWTAAMHAALHGHAVVIKALLDGGADAQAVSSYDGTAMALAALRGQDEAIRVLASHAGTLAATGGGALVRAAWAGKEDSVRLLLELGVHVNASENGRTPLMVAAVGGHVAIIRMLINAGADTLMEDCDGVTALRHARMNGHREIVSLLEDCA